MKYISIIRDYARKGDSMPPLEALRHITHLYMEQLCENIDLAHNIVKPWKEEWLRAYCRGAYECIRQFYCGQAE